MALNFVPRSRSVQPDRRPAAAPPDPGRQGPAVFGVMMRSEPSDQRPGVDGYGELLIGPAAVGFLPDAATRKRAKMARFTHTGGPVEIVKARLRPPWADTFLILDDGRSRLRLAAPRWDRRRLRLALQTAGIELVQYTAWRAPPVPGANG